jgi:hypothetical protein
MPSLGFLRMNRKINQIFAMTFRMIARKNPITMIRELIPGSESIGCLSHNMPSASMKHTLQMKAARQSILNKAIVQKSKFLHKIALFCLINQFQLYEFIAS